MIAHVQQLDLFPVETPQQDTSSTFTNNMSLPIHRWYRYSAGFSAKWAGEIIHNERQKGRHHILDPFAGSGTVLLESEKAGIEAIGIEAHPLVARLAMAKLHWRINLAQFQRFAQDILDQARRQVGLDNSYPSLITQCFPLPILEKLDALRRIWLMNADGSAQSELVWLALTSILRDCSPVGTAQWQYILPKKSKSRIVDPFDAFADKIALMVADMQRWQQQSRGVRAVMHQGDARNCASVPEAWADVVITSPPYANNYDYADATRLEMSFWGDIQRWGDLQAQIREHLIPSCTQHISKQVAHTEAIISDVVLRSIHDELKEVCQLLAVERVQHGGKKNYHTMIAAYFKGLAQGWIALRRVTREGATVCFVIGDSAPYGIYVPVDRWLGELALAAGFSSYTFEKTRDRNIKWKNRKHQVPLHEGRLWVRG